MGYNRSEDPICAASDVPERHILDVQFGLTGSASTLMGSLGWRRVTHWMLKTKSLVILPVALGNGETVVDIIEPHAVVSDVTNQTTSTAAA